jgi:hypothetical protein
LHEKYVPLGLSCAQLTFDSSRTAMTVQAPKPTFEVQTYRMILSLLGAMRNELPDPERRANNSADC